MGHVLTVQCKLNVSDEQRESINDTLQAFAEACNFVHQNTPESFGNAMRLQTLMYQNVRARFGLSANLTCQVMIRVAGNRKAAKATKSTIKTFRPTSIGYDARIFSFRERDWTASLTLLHGRERFTLAIRNYQQGLLAGKTPKSCTLAKRKDGSFYVNIQIESPAPDPYSGEKVIGIDLGRRDIAHTSEGQSFSGETITCLRDHYSKVRASIQKKASKGTRSTRRRARAILKRLSGRERRFQTWRNHTISHRLVQHAFKHKAILALEDLTGIRSRANLQPRNKTERRRGNSWAFYQLRFFLEYKARKYGVPLVLVNPAYTSQMCHRCYRIGLRTGKAFVCTYCDLKCDADLNGAINISLLGAAVTRPDRGPVLACSRDQGCQKPPALA